ncbi:MAG: thioesterase [Planctomycetes bacterium SCN 63-9]|nr:MAG: thioesterase [Planctomycetes bacterium SCN 63-9]
MSTDSNGSLESLLAGYPVVVTLPVQWGDQDAFRHVNNAIYFRWYESGRIAYNRRTGLMNPDPAVTTGPILAATSNNYRRQIAFPDTVHVGVRVATIGRTSLAFEHIIVSEALQAIAAEGSSTLVVFNYQTNRPQAVPDAIRHAIASLEGKSLESLTRSIAH